MKRNVLHLSLLIIGFCMLIVGIFISVIEKPKTLPLVEEENKELSEKEINRSKKEVINAISKYTSSLTSDINNLDYVFTGENTIYAVPIECIELYKAKENFLGMWKPVSDNYWAYALVQYDDMVSAYYYGFTFKDSEGYGIYPTTTTKILEDGSQIQKNLNLLKPKIGLITEITSIENWKGNGFRVNEETKLVVLEAQESGDNVTTCTIK